MSVSESIQRKDFEEQYCLKCKKIRVCEGYTKIFNNFPIYIIFSECKELDKE